MTMFALLMTVALLAFVPAFLIVRLMKQQKQDLMKVEYLKARVGVVNHYQSDLSREKGCQWCAIGMYIGPRSTKELEENRQLLVAAGFRDESHLGAYFFIKYVLVLLSIMVMLGLWAWFQIDPIIAILVPTVMLIAPERILIAWSKRRLSKVNNALPDFLDMANICMNAGLTYLESIKRVGNELVDTHPEICFEFNHLIEQIKIGVPRHEALKQFAARNPTKDIQELVQVLIQNEKLGSPISAAISDFSRRMYQDRENLMEEKAAKTSAKMAIVILPFLMVPYFILLLGEKMVMLGRSW